MAHWLREYLVDSVIRFDRFMELALYHPEHGYYSARVQNLGPGGDFTTTPAVDRSLGRAIARWCQSEAHELGLRRPVIIELGAGPGDLARAILGHFPLFQKPRYLVVETSPAFRRRLAQFSGFEVFGRIEDALRACERTALIISNEFVDAFPCRRLRRLGEGWEELYLRLEDEHWFEEFLPTDLVPVPDLDISAPQQIVEVHDSFHRWLALAVEELASGAFLTIDYGGTAREIYHRRPAGTLRAYYRQQRLAGREIYLRVGQQDLTADVNFSNLIDWGRQLGLQPISCQTQREFVLLWCPQAARSTDERTVFVLDPAGAGGGFRVLHQRLPKA